MKLPTPLVLGASLLAAASAAVVVSLRVGSQHDLGDVGVQAAAAIEAARVDRTIVGAAAGGALGAAGAVLQRATRNPLADPGVMGVTSGAALAVVCALVAGVARVEGYVWWAAVGALVAVGTVLVLTMRVPTARRPITTLLVGPSIASICVGVQAWILLTQRQALEVFRQWQVGSVAGRPAAVVAQVAPLLLVGLLLIVLTARGVDAVRWGDDVARGQGVHPGWVLAGAAVGASLLAASATALAGPLAFVGVMAPWVVQYARVTTTLLITALSAVTGAVLVVVCDVVGRLCVPSTEIAAGIVTSLVGAPVVVMVIITSWRWGGARA